MSSAALVHDHLQPSVWRGIVLALAASLPCWLVLAWALHLIG